MLSALMQIAGHEALEGHIGSWGEELIDALPTLIPAALPLDDIKRHALEGGLRGLLARAKSMGAGANEGWFKKELGNVLGVGGAKDGGKSAGLVNGLTAIGGMSKEARTAFGAVMALPGADALIDRLMKVETTSQTLEPAFLMPTSELQKKTLEKILGRIEADAVAAKALKPAGKGPIDALFEKIGKVVDLAGMNANLQAQFVAERAELVAAIPATATLGDAEIDTLADEAAFYGETLLETYRRTHP